MLTIRNLTHQENDLLAADALLMAAFGAQESRAADLRRYLTIQPDGWFVAHEAGALIGMGGAVNYGPFAYIGLVSVHPETRRRGVARTLMNHLLAWLDACGVPLVRLDSTDMGYSLYLSLGFKDCGTACVFRQEQWVRPDPATCLEVETLDPASLPALVAFDTPIFGADRTRIFHALFSDYPGRCLVTRDAAGQISGYVFATHRLLGPWVANDPASAELLLRAALCLPWEDVPRAISACENPAASELLARYGFEHIRTGPHMLRGGSEIPGQRALIYGQTSFAIG